MVNIARVGDNGSHNGSEIGTITSGLSSVTSDTILTAFVGSSYNCPLHGVNSIISSPVTTVTIGGNVVAMIGSVTACGAIIDNGSTNVTV